MMRNFIKIVIVAISLMKINAVTLEEQKQMLIGIARECKAIEGASDDDIGRLAEKLRPDTREGKCLFACILEKLNMMKDQELNKESFLAFAKVILAQDAEKMKSAAELADECMHIKENDRCDLAFKTGECVRIGGIVKKVDFGF